MPELFVSYTGHRASVQSQGWITLNHAPVRTSQDVLALCDEIERARGYDPGSLVIVSFQRLED